jgi:hypothetical protein
LAPVAFSSILLRAIGFDALDRPSVAAMPPLALPPVIAFAVCAFS